MAKQGLIDAVLTDDGDALIFGCPKIVRNSSSLLSGYRPSSSTVYTRPDSAPSSGQSRTQPSPAAGPPSKHQVTTYSLSKIRARLGFQQTDLILIALLSGADYAPTGLPGLGVVHTIALVSHGFATQLLSGLHELRYRSDEEQGAFLGEWREAVAGVLERDVEGMMGSRQVGLARMVREARGFPDLRVIEAYLKPVVTRGEEMKAPKWDGEPDLKRVVRWCVDQLMWSEEDTATHLRNLLWKGLAMRHLRLSALAIDRSVPRSIKPGTSAILARLDAAAAVSRRPERITTKTMIVAVHESKKADSTEGVASYRVELNPAVFEGMINPHFQLADLSVGQSASSGQSPDPAVLFWPAVGGQVGAGPDGGKQAKRVGPCHWISRSFLDLGREEVREMVEQWEARVMEKERARDAGLVQGGRNGDPLGGGANGGTGGGGGGPGSGRKRKASDGGGTSQSSLSGVGKGKLGGTPASIDIATVDSDDEDYLPRRLSLEQPVRVAGPAGWRRTKPAAAFRPDKRARLPTPPRPAPVNPRAEPQVIVLDDSDGEGAERSGLSGVGERGKRGAATGGGGRAEGKVEVVDLTGE